MFSLAAGFSLVFIFSSVVAIKTVFWRRFSHFYSHFDILFDLTRIVFVFAFVLDLFF